MKKIIVMSMSGGLDSSTLCARALVEGNDVFVINFNYGQKHVVELKAFDNIYSHFQESNFPGKIIGLTKLDLEPLLNQTLEIWKQMRDDGTMKNKSNHTYYTPSRNLMFSVLSLVVGEIIALSKNYDEISIGLGIHQHSKEAYGEHKDYWDITPKFAKRLQDLISLNDVVKCKIYAPYADKYKKDIVQDALELKVPINKTWTCYHPIKVRDKWVPCLQCEACKERQLAGKEAGYEEINEYSIDN